MKEPYQISHEIVMAFSKDMIRVLSATENNEGAIPAALSQLSAHITAALVEERERTLAATRLRDEMIERMQKLITQVDQIQTKLAISLSQAE